MAAQKLLPPPDRYLHQVHILQMHGHARTAIWYPTDQAWDVGGMIISARRALQTGITYEGAFVDEPETT